MKLLTTATRAHSPRYINQHQSAHRGIAEGWYAANADGALSFGPFSNRETCLTRIDQFLKWSVSSRLRQRPT
jgi:hypothetical protein